MPPKPPRKISVSGNQNASTSMPPPPNPGPPQKILEAEVNALSNCLRNAVVKAGQVYGYYHDTRKLGIHQYAPHPPRSLTTSLGREIEKYDQLCDAIESRLDRAIAVLQRDSQREEQRLKAEAEAAAKKNSETIATDTNMATPPGSPSQATSLTGLQTDLSMSKNPLPTPVRRQSTVSLSSLQRAPFPHKLDLSPSLLRINSDDVLPSGLSSPVTLAPKSSHRNLPQDLVMAALGEVANRPVDIDLTVGDAEMDLQQAANAGSLDPSLGSSADKPIELDLDIDMDLFGHHGAGPQGTDATGGNVQVGQFFDPSSNVPNQNMAMQSGIKPKEEEDLFDALKAVESVEENTDIFAHLDDSSLHDPSTAQGASTLAPMATEPSKGPGLGHPSPSSMLANFGSSSMHIDGSTGASTMHPSNDGTFDFNMGDFHSLDSGIFDNHEGGSGMSQSEMENLFNISVNEGGGGQEGKDS